jgi:hypothetical protein
LICDEEEAEQRTLNIQHRMMNLVFSVSYLVFSVLDSAQCAMRFPLCAFARNPQPETDPTRLLADLHPQHYIEA